MVVAIPCELLRDIYTRMFVVTTRTSKFNRAFSDRIRYDRHDGKGEYLKLECTVGTLIHVGESDATIGVSFELFESDSDD